ncbi:MAG: hypothetical protein JSR09_09750 [Bacteroidetes bacterium]|nr:hypothetical protein [Bacteroidota bacterium]
MTEKIGELIKSLRPERFPIVLIVGLILYAIIDQNSNPYQLQHSKVELIKEIKTLSSDTLLNKKINGQLTDIIETIDKPKTIETNMIFVYIGVSLFICLFLTIWGFINQKTPTDPTKKKQGFGGYILGLVTLTAPVAILSFIFNYYVINNHYVTLGITAILTFVLMRVHSINKTAT